MKIVINDCYGGFSLSPAQRVLLGVRYDFDVDRTNLDLITSVEAGDEGGMYAKLKVVEFPDGASYFLKEYDGKERIYWSNSEIHILP